MTVAYRIDLEPCINCSLCRKACPTEAISYFSTGRRIHVIDPSLCIGCDICAKVCPPQCIHQDPGYVIDPGDLASALDKARAFAKKRHALKAERKRRALAFTGAGTEAGSRA